MKKSKFFKTLAVFGACLGAPLLLTGCQSDDNDLFEFRVQDGYVQYTKDGTTWENIISADDLKGVDGKGIKSIAIDSSKTTKTKTTYVIMFDDNTTYTYEVFNGIDGKDGSDGIDGTNGKDGKDGADGIDGIDGVDGKDGTDGKNGKDGVDGNGIKSITIDQLNSDSTKTTYIITFDDNTTYAFEVKNGINGKDGKDGADGIDGTDGKNGKDGVNGTDGKNGKDGVDGKDGIDGKDGNGIKSITIDQLNSDSTKTTYIITFDDNTTYAFEVKNGINGTNGKDAVVDTYTITYDYGVADSFFDEVVETETIKATQWLTTLPEIKSEYKDSFLGWFVEGTEKQIKKYDFIGDNITLEARFDVKIAPSGLYQNGKYITTWDNLISRSNSNVLVLNRYDGHIIFDNSITKIPMGALENETEITGITINSEISIGVDAFAGCSSLKNVYFGSSNITLGDEMFKDCVSLEEIVIPGTIKSIPQYMFSGCTKLSNIILQDGVETISGLIASNTSVKTITLPKSITNIDPKSFVGTKFEEYIVDVNNDIYKSIDGLLYSKDGTELISCPSAFIGVDGRYTIPNEVTQIGYQAFYLSELTSITLPNTIQTINNEAFYSCKNLNGMYIPESVTKIGYNAFKYCKEDCILIMNDEQSVWSVNNINITISSDGRSGSVDGGENISLTTLLTSTYAGDVWTKQKSE